MLFTAIVTVIAGFVSMSATTAQAATLAWQNMTNLTIQTSIGTNSTLVLNKVSAVRKRTVLSVYNPGTNAAYVKLGVPLATNDTEYIVVPAASTVPILTGGTDYNGSVSARSSATNDSPTLLLFEGGF